MMKNTKFFININRFFNLMYYNLLNLKNYVYINYKNIIVFIFIAYITIKFCYGLFGDLNNLIIFMIYLVISILLNTFVLDKFQFSKNIVIRFLQRFVIFYIMIMFVTGVLYYFGIFSLIFPTVYCSSGSENSKELFSITLESKGGTSGGVDDEILDSENDKDAKGKGKGDNDDDKQYVVKIDKKIFHKGAQFAKETAKVLLEHADTVLPGFGGGMVGTAMVKYSQSMPPLQRLGMIAGTTVVAAAGTKIGTDIGKSITSNTDIMSSIKKSEHSNPDPDRVPSPDNDFINSPLEITELYSPLEVLIISMFKLNVLIFVLIIILLWLIFNRYIINNNLNLISSFVNKYTGNWFKNWFFKALDKGIDYRNNTIFIIFIFVTIILLMLLILNMYVSVVLMDNIDDYVTVYNHIKNTKSLLFLGCCPPYFKTDFYYSHKWSSFPLNSKSFYSGLINRQMSTIVDSHHAVSNYTNYVSKNDFNKKNILSVYNYILSDVDSNKNVDYMSLKGILEKRVINNNFLHEYVHTDSFININIIEDVSDVDTHNMVNKDDYKLRFEKIIASLAEDHIYKMIFRWETVELDNFGYRKSNYNSSPSFFIYKNMDVNIILYRYSHYLNLIINQYSISENINLDIFIKEWISYKDFNRFYNILNIIKKKDVLFKDKFKKEVMRQQKKIDSNSLFKNFTNPRKLYLVEIVKGLNYGKMVDEG